MIRCSVGLMAHNEEANIGALLDALAGQRLRIASISEIIVVASGCTDATERIVKQRAVEDPRIRLIREPSRRGKAAAINLFLDASKEKILILQSADTLPDADAIERLAAPFLRREVGMVGARPVPLNDDASFCGYAIHFIWELHHRIALVQAKCGELVAFRRTFRELPPGTVVDEPMIEAFTHEAGLKIAYQPGAVVYNLGPDNVREIFSRRRSIVTGYLLMRRLTRYRVATMGKPIALRMAFEALFERKGRFLWALGACAIELAARVAAWLDYKFKPGRAYHIWEPARSTKKLPAPKRAFSPPARERQKKNI